MIRSWLLGALAAILWASPAWGVDDVPQPWQGGTGCESTDTIAGLPTSPLDGTICGVTNGSTAAGDCSTTGTDHIVCYYDSAGAVWRPLARGISGTPGDITDVFNCSGGDCADIVMGATDSLDASGIDADAPGEGIRVPQTATCGGTGYENGALCYSTSTDSFCVGDGSAWDCVAVGGTGDITAVGDCTTGDCFTSGGTGTTLQGAGSSTLTIVQGTANTLAPLTIQNTVDNANDSVLVIDGPNRGTSANDDRLRILFKQEDQSGTRHTQTEIVSRITDRSTGLVDAQIEILAAVNNNGTDPLTRIILIGSDPVLGTPIVTLAPDGEGTDFRYNADTLDGAYCWDGNADGTLLLGTGQSAITRCNGNGRSHGTITGGTLALERLGDAILVIHGDSDDSNEGDNPELHFVQDGETNEFTIAFEGTAGTKYTNSSANAAYIEAGVTGTADIIEFATSETMQLRISPTETDVKAGSSTDVAAVGGIMSVNNTAVANVGASGPDDLVTYSIPANTLATNGDMVMFEADFTFGANAANSKEFRMVLGTTTLLTSTAQLQGGGTCSVRGYITKTGTNTEDFSASMICDAATPLFADIANFGTATETLTGALTLKGQSVTSTDNGDVQMENLRVWFYPNQT